MHGCPIGVQEIIYEHGADDATKLVNLGSISGNSTESSTIDNTADCNLLIGPITS
jgi:hypothetical protein